MDKITRLLLLYSRLFQGQKVNKLNFCMETDCLPRSFDRDIEDIRLYLSELFYAEELVYNRQENTYYLSKTQHQPLEVMEYLFVERVLLDTGILRNDEMDGLLFHLAQNTENTSGVSYHEKECLKTYNEPLSKVPILKMHGDLQTIIKKKFVIEIQYTKMDGITVSQTVIPCIVRFDLGYLYLIAYRQDKDEPYPAYYRLDRIYSFSILREQTHKEIFQIEEYVKKYSFGITQMYGGNFIEITLECNKCYFPYVYDKFRTVSLCSESADILSIKIKAFDDGFVKWIISQPTEHIRVIEPATVKNKIRDEAQKLIEKYTEVQ